jgi:hypothetical protein
VSIALLVLILLIGASPAILLIDGPGVYGGVAATVAVAVVIVAQSIRAGQAEYLVTQLRSAAFVILVPALWIFIQILPLGPIGLSHTIWETAHQALRRPIMGSISIDTGATLISLCRYLSLACLLFVASAIAIDRERAAWLLFALLGATVVIAAIVIAADVGKFTFKDRMTSDYALATATVGTIVSATAATRAFERLEIRGWAVNSSSAAPVAGCLAALLLCLVAIILDGDGIHMFGVGYGLAAFGAVVVIRHFGLGLWGRSAMAAAALTLGSLIAYALLTKHNDDLTLIAASHASTSLIATTRRILADINWTGVGAGTFASLLPIYRDADDLIDVAAPTAAAAITIELGRPMFWAIAIAAIFGILALFQAALRRGRDSFYPAAGASCLVTMFILSFGDAGLFGTTPSIVTSTVLGLAFAQTRSRSLR